MEGQVLVVRAGFQKFTNELLDNAPYTYECMTLQARPAHMCRQVKSQLNDIRHGWLFQALSSLVELICTDLRKLLH